MVINNPAEPLFEVSGLEIGFRSGSERTAVVEDVRLHGGRGERIAIVGESGSGKSVTVTSLLGLLPDNADVRGRLRFAGQDFDLSDTASLRSLRGGDVGMVFQDPMSSLNPTMTIGKQMTQAAIASQGTSRRVATAQAEQLLAEVGIVRPRERLEQYPHEFSGGMRQRIMIASALMLEPAMLLADEPTTALDVTVQKQILRLLRDLSSKRDLCVVLITHDLGVVASFAERAYVMYAGRVVEESGIDSLIRAPRHPYAEALVSCIPRLDLPRAEPLHPIPGMAVGLQDAPPAACSFAPRCAFAHAACQEDRPLLEPSRGGSVACWLGDGTGLAAGEGRVGDGGKGTR